MSTLASCFHSRRNAPPCWRGRRGGGRVCAKPAWTPKARTRSSWSRHPRSWRPLGRCARGRCCSRAIERVRLRATTPDASFRFRLSSAPRCSFRSIAATSPRYVFDNWLFPTTRARLMRKRLLVSLRATCARPAAPPVDHDCNDESGPAISGCRCGRAIRTRPRRRLVRRLRPGRRALAGSLRPLRSPRPAAELGRQVLARARRTPSHSRETRRPSRRSRPLGVWSRSGLRASSDGSRPPALRPPSRRPPSGRS